MNNLHNITSAGGGAVLRPMKRIGEPKKRVTVNPVHAALRSEIDAIKAESHALQYHNTYLTRLYTHREAINCLEQYLDAGYTTGDAFVNAVLAVHPTAHVMDLYCFWDMVCFNPQTLTMAQSALTVLKPLCHG